MSLAELEQEVQRLSPSELGAFTKWLDEYAAARWDNQIERHVAEGKLSRILDRVDSDFESGRCTEL